MTHTILSAQYANADHAAEVLQTQEPGAAVTAPGSKAVFDKVSK